MSLKLKIIKAKTKLLFINVLLKISYLVYSISNLLDKLAAALQPGYFLVNFSSNKKPTSYQILGASDAFGGKKYFEVYADGVDWQHEFGNIKTHLYSSEEEIKTDAKCWKGCGIVKLTLKVVDETWVHKQDLFNKENLVTYKPKKGKNNGKKRRKRNASKAK